MRSIAASIPARVSSLSGHDSTSGTSQDTACSPFSRFAAPRNQPFRSPRLLSRTIPWGSTLSASCARRRVNVIRHVVWTGSMPSRHPWAGSSTRRFRPECPEREQGYGFGTQYKIHTKLTKSTTMATSHSHCGSFRRIDPTIALIRAPRHNKAIHCHERNHSLNDS